MFKLSLYEKNKGFTLIEVIFVIAISFSALILGVYFLNNFSESNNNNLQVEQNKTYFKAFVKASFDYVSGLGSGQNNTITVQELKNAALLPKSFPSVLAGGGTPVAIYATDPLNKDLMDLVITEENNNTKGNSNIKSNISTEKESSYIINSLSSEINIWLGSAKSGPIYTGITKFSNNNYYLKSNYQNKISITQPQLTKDNNTGFYDIPSFVVNSGILNSNSEPFILITAPNQFGFMLISILEAPDFDGNNNLYGIASNPQNFPTNNQQWFLYYGSNYWYEPLINIQSLGFTSQCPESAIAKPLNIQSPYNYYSSEYNINTGTLANVTNYCIPAYRSQVLTFNDSSGNGSQTLYLFNPNISPSSWGSVNNINNWNTIFPTFGYSSIQFLYNFDTWLPLYGNTLTPMDTQNGDNEVCPNDPNGCYPSIWSAQNGQDTWVSAANTSSKNFTLSSNFQGLMANGVIPSAQYGIPVISQYRAPLSDYGNDTNFLNELISRGFLQQINPSNNNQQNVDNYCNGNSQNCYGYTLPPPPEYVVGSSWSFQINGNTYVISAGEDVLYTQNGNIINNQPNVNGVPLSTDNGIAFSGSAAYSIQAIQGTNPPSSVPLTLQYYANGDSSNGFTSDTLNVNTIPLPLQ